MARKRALKLDPCQINLKKIRALKSAQLMKIWSRLKSGRFVRTSAGSAFVGFVANLGTAKSIAEGSTHKDNPAQRKRSLKVYAGISRQLEKEFIRLREKSCKLK